MAEETPETVEETPAASEPTPDAHEALEAVAELGEDVTPEEAVEVAKKARKSVSKKRTKAKPKCDNHPNLDAVLVTTRGGRCSEQKFCAKCEATLPPGYADAH